MSASEQLNSLVRHAQADPSCSKETVLIRVSQIAAELPIHSELEHTIVLQGDRLEALTGQVAHLRKALTEIADSDFASYRIQVHARSALNPQGASGTPPSEPHTDTHSGESHE